MAGAQQAQAVAFTLGPGCDNNVLDFTMTADSKLYYKTINPLDTKSDGTLENSITFLAIVKARARQYGWSNILAVPVAALTWDLLSEYGRISTTNITTHTATYILAQTRSVKNSEMLYLFLMNSMSLELTTKLSLY